MISVEEAEPGSFRINIYAQGIKVGTLEPLTLNPEGKINFWLFDPVIGPLQVINKISFTKGDIVEILNANWKALQ